MGQGSMGVNISIWDGLVGDYSMYNYGSHVSYTPSLGARSCALN